MAPVDLARSTYAEKHATLVILQVLLVFERCVLQCLKLTQLENAALAPAQALC